MDEESLLSKVQSVAEKSGFPLQLWVGDLLQHLDYHVAYSLFFLDRDEGKGRESDLRALKNFVVSESPKCWVRHCLLIECKKSTHPWVVFTSPVTPYDRSIATPHFRGGSENERDRFFLDGAGAFESQHPLVNEWRRGRGFFEAFNKDQKSGTARSESIFKSLVTCAKATIEMSRSAFAADGQSICFYYPVVVFDGNLFEASMQGGSIRAQPCEKVVVSFSYRSAAYDEETFYIPIITTPALRAFLIHLDGLLHHVGNKARGTPAIFKGLS